MSDVTQTPLKPDEVECRKCHARYVPSFSRDFYPDGADPKVGVCERCMMTAAFAPRTNEPHKLEDAVAETRCKRGQGPAACAFLTFGGDGFGCAKSSAFESAIRQKITEGTMKSKGDNCAGPPNFTPWPS